MVATPPALTTRALEPALHGTVVALDAASGAVVVRHAAFAGMPAMTMTFRVGPHAPALRAGDVLRATVNERTEPWTLDEVRVRPAVRERSARAFVPVLHEGDAVPALTLIDQRGLAVSSQVPVSGMTTIVSFVFTRCRDGRMCPLVAAKFARMQRTLRGTPIHLLLVTLDPAYDTPSVLARYGAAYGADATRWTLATGTRAAVDEFAGRLGIALERPAPGVVAHTEAAIIIDAQGRIARIIDGAEWAPDDLVASAREVAGLEVNPIRRVSLWLGSSASALCGGGGAGLSTGVGLALLLPVTVLFGLLARRAFGRSG